MSVTVSSHTPLRGYSLDGKIARVEVEVFQVIPPCGGIRVIVKDVLQAVSFKSYPLAGVFRTPTEEQIGAWAVSSHTPLRGYSRVTLQFQRIHIRVSSHTPLRGSSPSTTEVGLANEVSSHTPLRGYSFSCAFGVKIYRVSSHTPLRGYSAYRHHRKCHKFVSSHTPLRGYSEPYETKTARFVFQVIPPCGGIRQKRFPLPRI